MQSVHLNGITLPHRHVICEMSHRFVLGPLLFTLYMADIDIIVQSFGQNHHTYAKFIHLVFWLNVHLVP